MTDAFARVKRPTENAIYLYRDGRVFYASRGDDLFSTERRYTDDAIAAAFLHYGDDAEIWVLERD